MRQAVLNVGGDRQVRKERERLKDEADVALLNGDVDAGFGVQDDSVANHNPPRIWFHEPGQASQQGRLSGTRRSKENGDAGLEIEHGVQVERRRQTLTD